MEIIRIWIVCGAAFTFFVMLTEYLLKYDRVMKVIEDNPNLGKYELFLRLASALLMMILWPFTLYNVVRGLLKGIREGMKGNE